jgi:hypothetical protein
MKFGWGFLDIQQDTTVYDSIDIIHLIYKDNL